ncbi:MAG: hypothetical protein RL748_3298, partial [Pseudomonadota bacterium]
SVGVSTNSGFDYTVDASTISSLKNGTSVTSVTIGRTDSTAALTIVGASDFGTKPLTLNAGSITDSGTQLITAPSVVLNVHNGAIGSKADPIDLASASVSINTAGGSAFVKQSGGFDLLAANLGAGTLGLTAGGGLTQTGVITADTLTVTNVGGPTNFAAAVNKINHIGGIVASGQNVSLKVDATKLDQSGAISAGGLNLNNTTGATDFSSQTNAIASLGIINSPSGAFTLNNQGTALGVAAINAPGQAVTIDTTGSKVTFSGGTINAATLSVTSTGVDQTAPVHLKTTASFAANGSAVKLDDANLFDFPVSVSNTGANTVSIRNSGALQIGTITTTSDLTLKSAGAVTSGTLSVGGNTLLTLDTPASDVTLADPANSFTGTVTIANGTGSARDVSISNSVINSALATLPTGLRNLTLNYPNSKVTLADTTLASGGNLSITAGGAISAGALLVPGSTTLNAGNSDITVTNPGNDLRGTVVANGANVKLSANALQLGTSTISGTLDLTADLVIGQTGPLVVSGATSVTQTGLADINLSNSGNNFKGGISVTGANTGDFLLTDSNANVKLLSVPTTARSLQISFPNSAIALPDITANGLIFVAAGGNISQQTGSHINASSTSGSTTLSGNGTVIDLTNTGNVFAGTVLLNGTNATASINTANPLKFDFSSVGGLNVSSGILTQVGALNVSGATVLDSGASTIALTNIANSFGGAVAIPHASAATLANSGALVLDTTLVTGNLALMTRGGLSQNGALTVGGTTQVTLDTTTNQNVILNKIGNDFAGSLTIATANGGSAQDITVANSHAGAANVVLPATLRDLTLTQPNGSVDLSPTITVRNLNVTMGGAITQSGGSLNVTGDTLLDSGPNPISLTNANNDFVGLVGLKAGAASITDQNALTLSSAAITGALTLNVGGDLGLSNSMSVGGATTINLNANPNLDVNFNRLGNIFMGPIAVVNAGGTARDVVITNDYAGPLNITFPGGLRNLQLRQDNGDIALPALTLTGFLGLFTGGSITQTGPWSVATTTSLRAGGSNDIILDKANDLQGATTFLSGRHVTLNDINALTIGTFNGGISGNLQVMAGGPVTQGSTLSIGGSTNVDAGANSITLTTNTNDFNGAVSLKGSDASLADANQLTLGSSTLSGNLNLNLAGNLTQNAALTVGGGSTITLNNTPNLDVILNNPANNFTGNVSIVNGSGTLRDLNLVNSHASSADITLPTNLNNLTLTQTNGAVTLAGATLSGNLGVTANGPITQSGALTVSGNTTLNAGNNPITLASNNDFNGAVAITQGSTVTLADSNALTLGSANISGSLRINTGGNLSQSGVLTVGDTTQLDAGSNNITLNNADNNFGGALSLTARDVSLADANALVFGASTITGNLNVHVGGNLTQSGKLVVGGTTDIILDRNPGLDVLLSDATNDFAGQVSVLNGTGSTGNVNVANAHPGAARVIVSDKLASLTLSNSLGSLDVNATTVSGNLNIIAAGKITQNGALVVGGNTTLNAGNNDIILTLPGNDFAGSVSIIQGNNVTLNYGKNLVLGESHVGGNLDLTNLGNITQLGALSVGGNTRIDADSNAVNLGNSANQFGGMLAITQAGDVNIGSSGNVLLNGVHANGNFTLNAAGNVAQNLGKALAVHGTQLTQAISLIEPLVVAGNTSINLNTNPNLNVTLNAPGNDLAGNVSIASSNGAAGNISLVNNHAGVSKLVLPETMGNLVLRQAQGGVSLSAATVTGSLDVSAGGAITQTGAVTVVQSSTLNAGNFGINLSNPNND